MWWFWFLVTIPLTLGVLLAWYLYQKFRPQRLPTGKDGVRSQPVVSSRGGKFLGLRAMLRGMSTIDEADREMATEKLA